MMYVIYCLINYCHVNKWGCFLKSHIVQSYKLSLIVKVRYNFKQVIFEYRTIALSLFVEFMPCLELFIIRNYL